MVTTNDDALAAHMRRQRAFGLDKTVTERAIPGIYDVTMLGYNYRMNEIEAAIGTVQLTRVPGFLAARVRNDDALRVALARIPGIALLATSDGDGVSSRYCGLVMLSDALAPRRFEIVAALKARGVGTSIYYPHPVPHLTYFRTKYGYGLDTFPHAARISNHGIALPVGPHLTTDDMAYIAAMVTEAIAAVVVQQPLRVAVS